MSRNKNIHWNDPKLNREAKTAPIAAVGMEVIHSLICVLLFMFSARMMLADVFDWAKFTSGNIMVMCILSSMIIAVIESSYHIIKGKAGYFMRWGVFAAGILVGILYFQVKDHAEAILGGSQGIAFLYVEKWNAYYGISTYAYRVNLEYVAAALDFWMVVLCCFLVWEAKIIRKNMVLALAPATIFVAELMIGYSPKALGIFFALAGILLVNFTGWKDTDFRPMPGKKKGSLWKGALVSGVLLGVFVFLLCTIVNTQGTPSAQKLIENPEKIKKFQEDLETEIAGFSFWNLFDGNGDFRVEELNNRTPQYQNIPVLTLETDQALLGNLYLKGFNGDSYSNGKWKLDTDDFEKACREAGFDSDQVAKEMASLGMEKIQKNQEAKRVYDSTSPYEVDIMVDAILTYLDNFNRKAFFPYFIQLENEEVSVQGDCRYTKKRSLTEYSFSVWKYESQYQSKLGQFEAGTRLEWEDWYEEYVLEHYLEVPEGMKNVKSIAATISAMKYADDVFETVDTENEERLLKAYQVRDWLARETNYSLELAEIPDDTDPIEFFLETSKMGYCMHYASAAVMLLREMEVPARYASGYIVNKDAQQQTNNGYEVVIRDNKAHAWVEIYLNGVGWVPVEVTKGYNVFSLGENMETMENVESQIQQNSQEESNNSEHSEDSQAEESQSEDSQTNTSTQQTNPNNQSSDTGYGNGRGKPDLAKAIVRLLGIFSVIAVVLGIFVLVRTQKNEKNRLIKELKRKRTRRAIKSINRKIYKKLRFTGKIFNNHLRDEEYEIFLKKTFTKIPEEDWKRYMAIVKAAAFSNENLSVEEMEFCYKIYQKVMQNS